MTQAARRERANGPAGAQLVHKAAPRMVYVGVGVVRLVPVVTVVSGEVGETTHSAAARTTGGELF